MPRASRVESVDASTRTAPLVDAHLHPPPCGAGEGGFYAEATAATIGRLAVNSTNEADWQAVLTLVQACPTVVPFLGIHPWWAATVQEGWFERLALALATARAGIGEIGLDGLAASPADCQEGVFVRQLALAEELGLPVVIHCCRRWGRLLDLLASTRRGRARLIIHGFAGSLEIMQRLLDLGAMLSFGPALADPAREKVRAAFRQVPADRLLLESDWPPRRHNPGQLLGGEAAGPTATLIALYRLAAELKGMSQAQLRTLVWQNGQVLTH